MINNLKLEIGHSKSNAPSIETPTFPPHTDPNVTLQPPNFPTKLVQFSDVIKFGYPTSWPCKQARNWTLIFLHVAVEITSFRLHHCQLCTIVIVLYLTTPSP